LAGLFDKNCIVTHSNTIDGFDASEREYCQRMMNEPKLKTFVSHAFMSNMGFLNVTQTRRFNTEDSFLGMAAFGIDLSYFSEHLDVLQENNSTIIRIFDTRMLLIAKKPFQSKEIGTISSEKFIEKFIESGEKIHFIDRPLLSDQNDTIFFLRKVDELPFIIVMGIENKNALSTWYQRVLIIAFFLLAILLMAFIIVKEQSKIIQQNKALRKKEEELRLLATTDSLTGLLNRHGIKKLIEQEIKRFNRKSYPISLILLDIDHFKVINDKFGHPVGDKVLQLLSNTLQAVIRDTDYLVRWGGEEFLILATDTSLANAVVLSEKIRSALEKLSQPELPAFTVSIGVSEYQEQDSFDCWYNRTDAALYEAKENGRNRVVSSNKKAS